jgi:hypothetical protein
MWRPVFCRHILPPPSSALKMKAHCCRVSVTTHGITQCITHNNNNNNNNNTTNSKVIYFLDVPIGLGFNK